MKLNFESLEGLYQNFLDILPNILMALGLIILGWIVYKLTILGMKKVLKIIRIERLNEIINNNELIKGTSVKVDVTKIIIGTLKCLLILVFIVLAADMLHLTMVSRLVSNLIEYLPRFFMAVLIFAIGTYIASQLKKMIQNLLKSIDANGSRILGNVVFYLIFIFVSITALNQAGVNTDIISNNVSFILGAILITMTIAVGLGSRDIVYRLILGFYTKKNFEIGMKIQIDNEIGTIENIDNICLTLKTDDGKIVYPIKDINDHKIKIF